MKKFFALLVVLCLVFGFSASAWAEDISITSPSSGTAVGWNATITIQGNISDAEIGATYTVKLINANITTTTSSGAFSFTANASTLGSGLVTLNFSADKSVSGVNEHGQSTTTNTAGVATGSHQINIATKPAITASDLRVSCGGHFHTVSGSGNSFSCTLESTCAANTLAFSSTNTNYTITFNNTTKSVSSITAGGSYTNNISVKDSYNMPVDYTLTVYRPANILSTDATMGTVLLKSSGTLVGSASGSTRTITVPNAYSGSLSITATANDTKASASPSQSSITLSNAGTSYSFTVTVTAESGATQSYTYYVTREAAPLDTNTGISLVQLKSGTTVVASTSSSSGNISVPAAYSGALTIAATASGTGATITSISPTTLTLTNAGTAYSFSVTVRAQSGTTATYSYTATRAASTNILTSITFKYSTTTLGSIGAVSGTSTQSLNLNTTYTSANVSWVLADGATLTSAKWGGSSGTSISSGASVGLTVSNPQLVLTIKASNGTTYTATVNVSRSSTTANTLSSLYIKTKETSSTNDSYLFDMSPSFSASKIDYTVDVDEDYDTVYVYPTKTSSSATLTASGCKKITDYTSGNSGYYKVDLNSSGTNKLTLKVVENSVTTTYTVTFERGEDVVRNASLDSLYVSKSSSSTTSSNRYDLSPSFSYSRTTYDVSIPKSVSEVYLHFEPRKGDNATVTVSGATKVSDNVYKATTTTNRTKTVTIKVRYSSDTTTYTVNLNSGTSGSNALLSKLRVASRESTSSSYQHTILPSFDSGVKDYVVLVPYSSSSSNYVYVQATLDDKDDELTVAGDECESGDWVEVKTSTSKSTSVVIKVEDDDGNTSKYNLTIVAAPKSADDDATLDALSLRTSSSTSSALSLSPSFSSNTTSYAVSNVANSVDSLRVYVDPSDSSAWVIVNDVLVENDYAEVELEEGKNTIKVVVYAEDCETSKTYTITVNRGAGGGSVSTLSGLEVRYGSSANQTLNLIPSFNASTVSYKVNVDGTVNQVAFKPTATEDTSTITIKGMTEKSGEWTSYNALSDGVNTFTIIVTSGDGKSISIYSVEVSRGLSVVVSAQAMKVNDVTVTCAAYNVNGNNYFKLRDIAYALRGTPKSFDVTYNSTTRVVSMTSGRNYSIIGGEMVRPATPGKYQLSNQAVMLDGKQISLTAYNIDGNNYFMLREIGALFNFAVDYDSYTSTVLVDTGKVYTPES